MKTEDERQAELDALRLCLDRDFSKKILWRLLTSSGIFCSSYSPDASAAAFREGRRSIGLELLDMIQQVDPNGFPLLMLSMNAKNLKDSQDGSELEQ